MKRIKLNEEIYSIICEAVTIADLHGIERFREKAKDITKFIQNNYRRRQYNKNICPRCGYYNNKKDGLCNSGDITSKPTAVRKVK